MPIEHCAPVKSREFTGNQSNTGWLAWHIPSIYRDHCTLPSQIVGVLCTYPRIFKSKTQSRKTELRLLVNLLSIAFRKPERPCIPRVYVGIRSTSAMILLATWLLEYRVCVWCRRRSKPRTRPRRFVRCTPSLYPRRPRLRSP